MTSSIIVKLQSDNFDLHTRFELFRSFARSLISMDFSCGLQLITVLSLLGPGHFSANERTLFHTVTQVLSASYIKVKLGLNTA